MLIAHCSFQFSIYLRFWFLYLSKISRGKSGKLHFYHDMSLGVLCESHVQWPFWPSPGLKYGRWPAISHLSFQTLSRYDVSITFHSDTWVVRDSYLLHHQGVAAERLKMAALSGTWCSIPNDQCCVEKKIIFENRFWNRTVLQVHQ